MVDQLCSHCDSGTKCMCYVDDIALTLRSSKVSGIVKGVEEMCSGTLCAVPDPDGRNKVINVPCEGSAYSYYTLKAKTRHVPLR